MTPVESLCAKLLEVMKLGASTTTGQRALLLAPAIDTALDIRAILRASVGLSWPTLPPDQQEQLLAAFRRYTIAVYVSNFDQFSGQRFKVSPHIQAISPGEVIVETRFVPVSGSARLINYVMHRSGPSWRAVDVLADGAISRVAVQRSDWRAILTKEGSPALLNLLDRRADEILK